MPKSEKSKKIAPKTKATKPMSIETAIKVLRDADLFTLNKYKSRYELFLELDGKLIR